MTDGASRRRVEEICDAALDRDGSDRDVFLSAACGDDAALRQQVESLLAHAPAADRFLEQDALGAAAADVMGERPPPIKAGTLIGPYRITEQIGVGGMGEVYRARDTRLNRDVALKVLPALFATDPERLARFKREAHVLASLNHPHIAAIHGFEEAGGRQALVLELLDGPTLAHCIQQGPMPLRQALETAIQIADALATAHRAGIIHRDLKPGNIMLTKSGAKLLDFGLATTSAPPPAGHPSMAPTTPPDLTAEGSILGTFQYMAPEQLEGHKADARTDIFAFGTVVYEMVTGKKAFAAKSQASLIGAILKDDPPPMSSLQPLTPAGARSPRPELPGETS